MKIAVLLKEIIDLVEELTIMDDGSGVERDYLMYKANEFDDFALEEALQLKAAGHSVDAYAIDGTEVDSLLHTAFARGAENLFKVVSDEIDVDAGVSSRVAAKAFYEAIKDKGYDLVMTGVQGVTDIDGPISGHLSTLMNRPHMSVVVRVDPDGDNAVTCMKEFPGGALGEYTVQLPAVLGMQSARSPPGYLPIAKIRKASKEATINEVSVSIGDLPLVSVTSASIPQTGKGAEMIEGDPAAQAAKLVEIFKSKGVLS